MAKQIIGFAGRSRSGKSELARVCEDLGFQKLYFALPLKQMCADILDISITELNRLKSSGQVLDITIGEDICNILSDETTIPLDIVREKCLGEIIHTVRQMLQFIGTDLIRTYYPNWHVDKIKEMIEASNAEKIVVDDIRFTNEKNMLESMNADVWFIARPTLNNVSNHISETSISWLDCYNKIIVNDSTLSYLLFKWDSFMRNYETSNRLRDIEFEHIMTNGIRDGRYSMSMREMLFLQEDLFSYSQPNIEKEDVKTIRELNVGSIIVNFNDDHSQIFTNALAIEDIKKII